MALKKVVGELVYKITGDGKGFGVAMAKAEAAVKKLKKGVDSTESSFKKIGKSVFNVKNAIAGFVTGVAVRGLFNLAKAGANLDSLTQSFTRLSSSMGINTEEALDSLREFSVGTISEADLVVSANRAMVLGVANSTEEFGDLMQIARLKARDMGLTTTQAFNDIVTGIGRGSPLILDNLGIVVKATEAQNIYAASLGKVANELTENEKREALKFAVLKQGREQLEEVGELTVTYSERLQQASTFVTNLKDNVGRALLPAFASLLGATLDQNKGFLETTEQVNELGKNFYRIGQTIIGLANVFKVFFKAVKTGISVFVAGSVGAFKSFLETTRTIKEALGLDTTEISASIGKIDDFMAALAENTQENVESMVDDSGKVFDAFSEAYDPKNYQGLSDGQMAELLTKTAEASTVAGDSAEDAGKKLEEFQKKILGVVDAARDAQKAIGEDLNAAFAEFGESSKKNAEETVKGLAAIVLGAEQSIIDLKKQLKDTDDKDSRKEIKAEIKKQEEILKARKDFEEREAARITDIRQQLEDAGIDAAKAGVDGILEVRDLEAEIVEQKRIADLDEFARFEEQQAIKQQALVTALIAEVNILNEKLEKQKGLEADTTAFLLSQNELREDSVKKFADAAISKYGEMAKSLRSAISLQSRLNSLRSNPKQFHTGGRVGASGGEVHAGEYVIPANMTSKYRDLISNLEAERSGNVDNSSTINAPVTMNNQIKEGVDIRALGREFAFELGTLK